MYAENGKTRIYCESRGDGEAILFISGLGADHGFWSRSTELFPGYRSVSMDNRGIGKTVSSGAFSISDMAEDAIAVMDALDLDRVHVIGWSMGSIIARRAAAAHPDRFRDMVLVGSYLERPARTRYLLRGLLDSLCEGRTDQDTVFRTINSFCLTETRFRRYESQGRDAPLPSERFDPEGLRMQMEAGDSEDPCDVQVPRSVPALVIHGAQDIMVPPSEGRRTAVAMGAEYVELSDQGHRIPLSAYSQIADRFFRTHPAG